MKTTFIFLLFSFLAVCQEIQSNANDQLTYLNSRKEEASKEDYVYYRIISDYNDDSVQYQMTEYYRNGKMLLKGKISNKYLLTKEGSFVAYYEDGNKKSLINYKDSHPIGSFYTWHQNGKLRSEGINLARNKTDVGFVQPSKILQYWTEDGAPKVIDGNGYYEETDKFTSDSGKLVNGFKDGVWVGKDLDPEITYSETYDNGKFVSGVSVDKNGVKHSYKQLFANPTSKKGIADFYDYVSGNIRSEDVSGKLVLLFYVEKDGAVTDVQVLQSVNKMYDQEAIRAVRNYKHWNCAEFRGIKMRASYRLPITFR